MFEKTDYGRDLCLLYLQQEKRERTTIRRDVVHSADCVSPRRGNGTTLDGLFGVLHGLGALSSTRGSSTPFSNPSWLEPLVLYCTGGPGFYPCCTPSISFSERCLVGARPVPPVVTSTTPDTNGTIQSRSRVYPGLRKRVGGGE